MPTYFNINYELSPEEARRRIDEAVEQHAEASYVCVADGNILQMVHTDKAYRAVVNGSMFSICDSSWVPLFLKRIYGIKVPQFCGSQIFRDLVSSGKYRMYFMGGRQNVLDALKSELSTKYNPAVASMKFEELPFLPVEEFDYQGIAERVNADDPDIIWLSLGAPKQEIFMSRLRPYLKRGVIIAIGAAFKFYSGVAEKRAPEFMMKHHLEFLFRVFQNPEKQSKRCFLFISALPGIIFQEIKRKHK